MFKNTQPKHINTHMSHMSHRHSQQQQQQQQQRTTGPPQPPPPSPCPTCQDGIHYSLLAKNGKKSGNLDAEIAPALAMLLAKSYDPQCTISQWRRATTTCQQAWISAGLNAPPP